MDEGALDGNNARKSVPSQSKAKVGIKRTLKVAQKDLPLTTHPTAPQRVLSAPTRHGLWTTYPRHGRIHGVRTHSDQGTWRAALRHHLSRFRPTRPKTLANHSEDADQSM